MGIVLKDYELGIDYEAPFVSSVYIPAGRTGKASKSGLRIEITEPTTSGVNGITIDELKRRDTLLRKLSPREFYLHFQDGENGTQAYLYPQDSSRIEVYRNNTRQISEEGKLELLAGDNIKINLEDESKQPNYYNLGVYFKENDRDWQEPETVEPLTWKTRVYNLAQRIKQELQDVYQELAS